MRVLPDAVVPSREELETYWRSIGQRALKYLARRPLTLVRHVNGLTFFHKGPLPPIPETVHQMEIKKSEGDTGVRVWVDDAAGLLGLLDMDVVEIHPWQATVDDIEHPDLFVFDLDPGGNIEWDFVTDTAVGMRDFLKGEGFKPWLKTSGGKGLHLMVPLDRSMDWARARSEAKNLMARFAKRDPRYTISSNIASREGKVFLDYLRNGRGNTAVGAFSPRGRLGFPISYPITWKDLARGVGPDSFKLRDFIRSAPGARRSREKTTAAPSLPPFVPPQLARLVEKPPTGGDWIHEMKLDGYRGEIAIAGNRSKFYTRRGLDWSDRFGAILRDAETLQCDSALLDGEVVALDERGVPNFSMIQDAIASRRTEQLVYFAFDLLHYNGKDFTTRPLIERKKALRELLKTHTKAKLLYSDHIEGKGAEFFRSSCSHGLEGIVSKRPNEAYRPGRRDQWLKTKCFKRQEFVVGGWLPREEDPRDLAALLVGYFERGKLLFAGKVGTGFNTKTRQQLIRSLTAIERDDDPFEETPKEYRQRARWNEPRTVVEVDFAEFTSDGLLRHATFRGIREDKQPEEIRLEYPRPVPAPGVIASSKARWRRTGRH
jgi:DNA ligase D-like protein (predicted ligase)/DNA ligase D-like protein (predicted polymerase)